MPNRNLINSDHVDAHAYLASENPKFAGRSRSGSSAAESCTPYPSKVYERNLDHIYAEVYTQFACVRGAANYGKPHFRGREN